MSTREASDNPKPFQFQIGILSHRFSFLSVGLMQVYFITMNIYFIAKEIYLGVVIASFVISLLWALNVRKVIFSTSYIDSIFYAVGATLGSLGGLWSSASIIFYLTN